MTVPPQEEPVAQVEQQVTEVVEMKAITSLTQSTKVSHRSRRVACLFSGLTYSRRLQ
jgi:hypothetical protein